MRCRPNDCVAGTGVVTGGDGGESNAPSKSTQQNTSTGVAGNLVSRSEPLPAESPDLHPMGLGGSYRCRTRGNPTT